MSCVPVSFQKLLPLGRLANDATIDLYQPAGKSLGPSY
jgi:hypothetical protein